MILAHAGRHKIETVKAVFARRRGRAAPPAVRTGADLPGRIVRRRDLAEFGAVVHDRLPADPLACQVAPDALLRTVKGRPALDLRPDRR